MKNKERPSILAVALALGAAGSLVLGAAACSDDTSSSPDETAGAGGAAAGAGGGGAAGATSAAGAAGAGAAGAAGEAGAAGGGGAAGAAGAAGGGGAAGTGGGAGAAGSSGAGAAGAAGSGGSGGGAGAASGTKLFLSSNGDATVRVYAFDDTFSSLGKIAVCSAPAEVRSTRDGKRIWVVCGPKDANDPQSKSQVAFIDTDTLEVVNTVDVGVKAVHSYLMPDGRAFVCNDGSEDISIVDPSTFEVKTVKTGKGHHKAAFATDGAGGALRFAYVSNITDATIAVVDPAGSVVTKISVGNGPHGIDYSFVSKRVYNCSGDAQNSVEVIDTDGDKAHTVVEHIALDGARCGHIEVSPDGKYVWASQKSISKLARIDVATNKVDYFDGGPGPDWFTFTPGAVFASDTVAWTVAYLNTSNGQTTLYKTGPDPSGDGKPVTGHRSIAAFKSFVFAPNEELGSYAVINADHGHVHTMLEGLSKPKCATVAGGGQALAYPR